VRSQENVPSPVSISTLSAWFAESGARNAQCCAVKSKSLVYMAILRPSVIPTCTPLRLLHN
jgi:hypothetical protein